MNSSDLRFCPISLNDLRGNAPVQLIWNECTAKPALRPDEVHLWLTNMDRASWQPDALQHVLNENERLRATKFHFDADRNRFIVRRAILRQIISQYLGKIPGKIEFTENSFGKPALAIASGEPALQFNLTASGEWVIGAFTTSRRLGVDIEKVRQDLSWAEIAGQFFHSQEVKCIGELPEPERVAAFFRHWTMKEAFIKARGVGLERSLLEIDFTAVIRGGQKDYADADGSKWLCLSFSPGEGLVAGLVVES
jgi:4'-phosphopantetheinyl transferase